MWVMAWCRIYGGYAGAGRRDSVMGSLEYLREFGHLTGWGLAVVLPSTLTLGYIYFSNIGKSGSAR